MELIFIRHADTESGSGYAEDSLRALTPKGHRVHEQVARELYRRGFSPDIILSSPRLRANQTARITAQELPGEVSVIELAELDGGYALDSLLKRLGEYADYQRIACVGHEPDVTRWTNELLGEGEKKVSHFSKSAVVSISFSATPAAGQGHCNYFYSPNDLLSS